ncbi:ComEC/Rec2 family competence protein [Lentilactobacillus sp. SPB1-3]|uniref:ComEC/Rec2 family competence protein n=1 Tax=Lentilactobacillus terminaliae TaxID=3003483 RepID=A0ACD5DD46_9LACO|nr:ComEC/Rec2 family competence protein [Lentilactobacillus sp. SPB1-3]MCZ0977872.1 ComEC/Rec2 family competence protein [Lentilactobacillus sp. SPB1-3]
MIVAVITAFLFGLIILNNRTVPNHCRDEEYTERIRIYPDGIKVDGDLISFVSEASVNNRKSIYFGRLANSSQKEMILKSSEALSLSITAKTDKFKPPTNINEFDVEKYYHHQGIKQLINISKLEIMHDHSSSKVTDVPHILRTGLLRHTDNLPVELKRYCQALVIGFRDNDFYQQMSGSSKLGLLHVFSVSGMHVYYFLALIDKLLTIIKLPNRLKMMLEVCCLLVYFQFAGGSPGLLRAIVMAIIRLLSQLLDIEISGIDCWSLTLIMQLLMLPEAIFLLSVQLSYSLSLGIIITAKRGLMFQTIILNAISLPIILYNFYEWHWLSIVASLVFLPVFTSVIFPLVVIICIVGNVKIITSLFEWFVSSFNHLINYVGEMPGMINVGKPPLWFTIFALTLTYYIAINGLPHLKRNVVLLASMYIGIF